MFKFEIVVSTMNFQKSKDIPAAGLEDLFEYFFLQSPLIIICFLLLL